MFQKINIRRVTSRFKNYGVYLDEANFCTISSGEPQGGQKLIRNQLSDSFLKEFNEHFSICDDSSSKEEKSWSLYRINEINTQPLRVSI